MKPEEIQKFKDIGSSIGEPLKDFFGEFFYKAFNINNSSIVSRKLAVLPLVVYSYRNYQQGKRFLNINADNVTKMKQYFILSQLNDWNTQGIVEGSTRKIIDEMFPITMPYYPIGAIKVYCEEFLTDRKNGDFDTLGILYGIKPTSEKFTVDRYFKEEKNGFIEIDRKEYLNLMKMAKERESNG